MPLSDREQQILKEMERNLLEEQPEQGDKRSSPAHARNQIKVGAFVFFLGLLLLAAFFLTGALVLGIFAFVAMVAGLFLIATGIREAAVRNFRDLTAGGGKGIFGRWDQHFRGRGPRS